MTRAPRNRQSFPAHINMPAWLQPKIGPLLSTAETKEKFFDRIGQNWPMTSAEFRLIERAYDAAESTFKEKRRESGEPYFSAHLRASALICFVYLRIRDPDVIAAILLHDNWEDYPETWNFDRFVVEFNKRIAELVYWVTKPNHDPTATPDEVDRRYHRRLMIAPRDAMFVKLPERLHNMITIWGQPVEKIRRKVSETQDFVVPLTEKHHILIHEFEDVLDSIERYIAQKTA